MTGLKRLALCLSAFVVLSGQSPAPPAGTGKPIRHLVYSVAVDYQVSGNTQTDAIGTTGSGIVNTGGTSGRQGKLIADVMAVGTDGGLVVRVMEWQQSDPRPQQSYTCAVYGDTRVVCPPAQMLQVSDAENVLLALLGRSFVDPAAIDAKGAWQRSYKNADFATADTFTTTGSPDANPLTIQEHSEITSLNGAFVNWHSDAKIVYNTALSVPVSIHDVALQHARGNSQAQRTIDLNLVEDSLATH